MNPTDLRVEADAPSAWRTAAAIMAQAIEAGVAATGAAVIAVSGGETPRGLHRLLVQPPWADTIPWERLHVFWVDERLVPYEDPASNFGAALADWIDRLPRPPAGLYPVPVGLPPEAAAERYARDLLRHFGPGTEPIFDLVVLGIGDDGHTASLFPGHPVLDERACWTAAVKGGVPDVWRVTLTYPVLNRARQALFLVTGAGKADVVGRVLSGTDPALPAARVRPASGQVTWVLDTGAAERIERYEAGLRKA